MPFGLQAKAPFKVHCFVVHNKSVSAKCHSDSMFSCEGFILTSLEWCYIGNLCILDM